SWFDVVMDKLSDNGLLVMNFVNLKDWKKSAFFTEDFIQDGFESVFRFTTPTCSNHVVAFHRQKKTLADFKNRLQAHSILDERRKSCRLRYKAYPVKK
ncbi:MAG TPA: hypothetical protein VFM46_15545, partial [Pseudomonadales bacterium]|nr:hypothetical protein [Pseudomonadales bacterium]